MDTASPVIYACAFVAWVLAMPFAAFISDNKGNGSGAGFLLGFLFGPLGVVLCAILPANPVKAAEIKEKELLRSGQYRRCSHCHEVIRIQATVCPKCQREQTPDAARAAVLSTAPGVYAASEPQPYQPKALPIPEKPRRDPLIPLLVTLLMIAVCAVASLYGYLQYQRTEAEGAAKRMCMTSWVSSTGATIPGLDVDTCTIWGRQFVRDHPEIVAACKDKRVQQSTFSACLRGNGAGAYLP